MVCAWSLLYLVVKGLVFCSLSAGYGHTTPLSDLGKAFSILYALIGVPFTMLVLTACVQRLMFPLVLAPVGLLNRSGLEPRTACVVHFMVLLIDPCGAVLLCGTRGSVQHAGNVLVLSGWSVLLLHLAVHHRTGGLCTHFTGRTEVQVPVPSVCDG